MPPDSAQQGHQGGDERRRAALAALAPGTALRDGLERILRGNTGALIVLGDGPAVDEVCTGGFELRVAFSATRLRELAKMDGAIVLDGTADYIVRAAVHLVPDPALPTDESGTRHRTAERVARHTGCPVVSVSKSMRIIALYLDGARYVLEGSAAILSRANQALATLERYKLRLDEVSRRADRARDRGRGHRPRRDRGGPAAGDGPPHRRGDRGLPGRAGHRRAAAGAAVRRAHRGQRLRAAAHRAGLPARRRRSQGGRAGGAVLSQLGELSPEELLDAGGWPRCSGWAARACWTSRWSRAATGCWPGCRGCRNRWRERLVAHFGGLHKLLAASVAELQDVPGVAEPDARRAREGLSRLAEVTLLERYS